MVYLADIETVVLEGNEVRNPHCRGLFSPTGVVRLTRRRVLPSQCKVKIVRIGTGECAVEVFYETKNISVAKDNYIETKGSVVIEVTLTHPVLRVDPHA